MDLDGSDDAKKKDGAGLDGFADDTGVVGDSYIPPPPADSGLLWCGASVDAGGDAGAYCKGTCCVKVGNGYQFACKPLGDPCTGYNYAFSCNRLPDCKEGEYCCFTEKGVLEAGTYFAESHCGTCLQMESMCLTIAGDDCPEQTVCHPWFSNYGQCY